MQYLQACCKITVIVRQKNIHGIPVWAPRIPQSSADPTACHQKKRSHTGSPSFESSKLLSESTGFPAICPDSALPVPTAAYGHDRSMFPRDWTDWRISGRPAYEHPTMLYGLSWCQPALPASSRVHGQ